MIFGNNNISRNIPLENFTFEKTSDLFYNQNSNIAIKNNASDFEALFFDLVNSIFFAYFISHEYAEPSAKSACCFPTPSVLFALYR